MASSRISMTAQQSLLSKSHVSKCTFYRMEVARERYRSCTTTPFFVTNQVLLRSFSDQNPYLYVEAMVRRDLERKRIEDELRPALQFRVRSFLIQQHGEAFQTKRKWEEMAATAKTTIEAVPAEKNNPQEASNWSHPLSIIYRSRNPAEEEEPVMERAVATEIIETLAQLNGYKRVSSDDWLSQGRDKVYLARGLFAMATPRAKSDYIVFSRPHMPNPSFKKANTHPPFKEEDYSFYAEIESRIQDRLEGWGEDIHRRREQGLHTMQEYLQQVVDAIYPSLAVVYKLTSGKIRIVTRSLFGGQDEEQPVKTAEPRDIVLWSKSRRSSEAECRPVSLKGRPSEDLIILTKYGNSVVMVEDVPPQYHLLAVPKQIHKNLRTPYRLRHKAAGNLITVTIVLISTMPPAYRALKFIIDYPMTAEVVAASLIATIGYGIWSWRTAAKDQQAMVVHSARSSRLIATDSAAISHLRDSAVEAITDMLMRDYLSRLSLVGDDVYLDDHTFIPLELDFEDVAKNFGLLQNEGDEVVAVDWKQAREKLLSHARVSK